VPSANQKQLGKLAGKEGKSCGKGEEHKSLKEMARGEVNASHFWQWCADNSTSFDIVRSSGLISGCPVRS
jgi:hypothetical protein